MSVLAGMARVLLCAAPFALARAQVRVDLFEKLRLDAGKHTFVLIALVGGKGLSPSPGELAVSTGIRGELERLLGPDDAPHLTDAEWEAYVAGLNTRHRRADIARRRAASTAVV